MESGRAALNVLRRRTEFLAASKGEARRLIAGVGVSLNGARVTSPELRVRAEDAIDGQVLLLRKGKKENRVVRLIG